MILDANGKRVWLEGEKCRYDIDDAIRAMTENMETSIFGDPVERRVSDLRASILGPEAEPEPKMCGLAAMLDGRQVKAANGA